MASNDLMAVARAAREEVALWILGVLGEQPKPHRHDYSEQMRQRGMKEAAMLARNIPERRLAAIVAPFAREAGELECAANDYRRAHYAAVVAHSVHDGDHPEIHVADRREVDTAHMLLVVARRIPPTGASEPAPEPAGESAADPLGWRLAKGPDSGEWTVVDGGEVDRYAIFSGRDAGARARLYLESLREPAPPAESAPEGGEVATQGGQPAKPLSFVREIKPTPEEQKRLVDQLVARVRELPDDVRAELRAALAPAAPQATAEELPSKETIAAAMAATKRTTRLWRAKLDAAVAAEREACARIAEEGALVPPDGGAPTESERALCSAIARDIRTRKSG